MPKQKEKLEELQNTTTEVDTNADGVMSDEKLDTTIEEHEEAKKTKQTASAKLAKTQASLEQQARALQSSIASETKKILDEEPKVIFMVPLAIGEQPGGYEEVQINGVQFRVRKGEMVEVPRSVAKLLSEYYNIALNAGSDMLVTREKPGLETAVEA